MTDFLKIAKKKFSSRLILGTGKFPSKENMEKALAAAETEIVTVALRRVNLDNPSDNLLNFIDPQKYLILPNTSGAKTAEEAIRLARLAQASGISSWIKLEITPEPRYLLPDGEETLKAAEILVKEGFIVLPYINADPILARKLEDIGVATVMPLGSPIGSNKGFKTIEAVNIIIEQASVPVVVDAGLGRPSDAALALELGADAVLVNTAIATANNPTKMAEAFKAAVLAGRLAFKAGLATEKTSAAASSPLEWLSKIQ